MKLVYTLYTKCQLALITTDIHSLQANFLDVENELLRNGQSLNDDYFATVGAMDVLNPVELTFDTPKDIDFFINQGYHSFINQLSKED